MWIIKHYIDIDPIVNTWSLKYPVNKTDLKHCEETF
jgi:hypothetical protein